MFYRLLGKLFFLFWICPSIVRVMHVINNQLIARFDLWTKRELRKMDEQAAKSRHDHPAGTRRR